MSLAPGVRLGAYEIISLVGAGGMGEIYRARDTRLDRTVAIKVLADSLAADPQLRERFDREARAISSLNHPHICTLFDVGHHDGIDFLVLEYLEGNTLAERLARGGGRAALDPHEALKIAIEICDALDKAHRTGIVHRDLKPANVMLTKAGAKLLDFGLAKSASPVVAASGLSMLPTTPPNLTAQGTILGTFQYMAPEQIEGLEADARTDIFAFGALLFEMLTGRTAFEGKTRASLLGAILKDEPAAVSRVRTGVPAALDRIISTCLAKDPDDRYQSARDLLRDLRWVASGSSDGAVAQTGAPPARSNRVAWLTAAVLAIALVATAVIAGWLVSRPNVAPVTRLTFSPAAAAALVVDAQSRDLTITPDGRHIVYKGAGSASGTQLFVRALDELEPKPLTSAGAPRSPFASPDGQWIGFVEPSPLTLKKVAITGGPVLTICSIPGSSRGVTWGDDRSIIFATTAPDTGLQRVSSDGGEPTVLTKPNREAGEVDHWYPRFLPGSQAVLFTITSTTGGIDASQVAVLDLRTGTQKIIVRGGSQAYYVSSGHLVYVAASTLRAVAFDLERLEAIGTAVPVVPQVLRLPTGTAEFDIADDGTLVYVAGGTGVARARALVWVDRQGREEAVKAAPARAYTAPRLSPDGMRVAVEIRDQETDIWVWDLARATLARVTSDPGVDQAPAWMPDGRRVLFSSEAGGVFGAIFWRASNGTGTTERLTESTNSPQRPSAVTSDGTRVLFWQGGTATGTDVMMVTLDQDHRVQPLVQTPFVELNGEVSPDGQWLAYESNDSGQFEIAVRPFPDVNKEKWPVSTAGGRQPLWARNGQELFYRAPNGAVMSVPVQRASTWTSGAPTRLFDGQYFLGTGANSNAVARTYDVSPDGKRFLMIKSSDADQTAASPSIVVVQNWFEELKRLVPTAR